MSSVSKSTQFSSGFSPQNIPGLMLWLDAMDSRTVTLSGSNVTAWADKSPNGFNATSTGATNFPSYSNNALVYNGSAVRMQTAYTATPAAETIFAVLTWTAAAGDRNNFVLGSSALSGRSFVVNTGGGGNTGSVRWDVLGQGNYSPTAITRNARVLATAAFTGSAGSTSIYGSNQGTPTSFTISPGSATTNIGHIFTESDPMNGVNIHEIVVYSSVLPPAERQSVEGYLMWKWNLTTNTPFAHPHARIPPVLRTFQPNDIPGCILWLDAADPSTFSYQSGTSISQWRDKSGSANHFNTTTATFPTYNAATTAGHLPNIGEVDVPLGAIMLSTASFSISPSTFFAYVVAKLDAIAPSGLSHLLTFTSIATDGISGGHAIRYGNSFYLAGTQSFPGNSADYANQNYFINGTFNPPSNAITTTTYFNRHIVAGRSGAGGTTTISISGSTANRFLIGKVYEVLFFNTVPTDQQRQEVELYLADKWGMRSVLPTQHPMRLYRALALPFAPTQLADCRLWLDGADAGVFTFSTGSNVSVWRDKSGTNNDYIQSTQSAQPTLMLDTVYNRRGLYFNGANRLVQSNTNNFPISNTNTYSIFSAHRVANSSGTRIVYRGHLLGEYTWIRWQNTFASAIADTFPGGWIEFARDGVHQMNGTSSFIHDVSGITLYINGGSVGTGTKTTTAVNQFFSLGASPSSTEHLDGYIYEFIVFNRNLSQDQRHRVEGYLAWKWGQQGSLPATHPHRRFSP